MVLSDLEHCDLCVNESEAIIACNQCLLKLCEHHRNSHLITKTTAHHQLFPLHELFKAIALDKEVKFESNCERHHNQIANLFCTRCKTLCCIDCESSSIHSDHVLKPFDSIRSNLILKFEQEQIPETKMKLDSLLTVLNEIEVWEMELIHYNQTFITKLVTEHEGRKREMEKQYQKSIEFFDLMFKNNNSIIEKKRLMIETRINDVNVVLREYPKLKASQNPTEFIKTHTKYMNYVQNAVIDDVYLDTFDKQIPAVYPFLKPIESDKNVQYFTEYETFIEPLKKFKVIKESNLIEFDLKTLWFKIDPKELYIEPIPVFDQVGKIVSVGLVVEEDINVIRVKPKPIGDVAVRLVKGSVLLRYSIKGKGYKIDLPITWQYLK